MAAYERVEVMRLAFERHEDDETALALARRMLRLLDGSTAISHPGIPAIRARSSTVERSAHNASSVGSNPTGPTIEAVIEHSTDEDSEWTSEKDAQLRKLAAANWTDPQIAAQMGVSLSAVMNRRQHLDITKDRKAPRPAGYDRLRRGSGQPADLTPGEYRCWRAVAQAASKAGSVIDRAALVDELVTTRTALSVTLSHLARKGYVRLVNGGKTHPIHVVKWPEGMALREETAVPASVVEPPAEKRLPTRSEQFLEWLTLHADTGDILPVTQATALIMAGIPKGSHGFVKEDLQERGLVTWLSPPDGRWGVRLKDGREMYGPPLKPAKGGRPRRFAAGAYATRAPDGEPKAARRFMEMPKMDPEAVRGLPASHPAVQKGRTLFPTTVVDPTDSPRLLVSGQNSRKLGSHVTKGPWKGFPIYSLTLEERATCPDSCHLYSACYGNGMPLARRHKHGMDLVLKLHGEVADLAEQHPGGFVVRLHQLGDFYDVDYVARWGQMLKDFPALRCFGYTAWPRHSPIGQAVKALTDKHWERFAIRFSDAAAKPQGATSIARKPESPRVPEGIVCPAQRDHDRCCGTCGLCWHPNAKKQTIVFVLHGAKFKGRPPAQPVTQLPAPVVPAPEPVVAAAPPAPVDEAADAFVAEEDPAPRKFEAKQRRCLGCGRMFLSEWAGNRQCRRCRPVAEKANRGLSEMGVMK